MLVIFLSDNGPPFQGAKTTMYDPGVHLPLIVRRPATKHAATCAGMASWTDIVPTILDWAGVPAPKGLPGHSILPVLTQENPERWNLVYGSHQLHEITMYYPMRMVRSRTHKYILNLAHGLEVPHASDLWASPTWQGVLRRGDRMFGRRTVDGLGGAAHPAATTCCGRAATAGAGCRVRLASTSARAPKASTTPFRSTSMRSTRASVASL